MKRLVALGLLGSLVLPTPLLAQTDLTALKTRLEARPLALGALPAAQVSACDSSRISGRETADQRHGTAGWFLGGVGLGVGLGFIGTGIVAGASALTSPQPKEIPASATEETCYRDGYKAKAKNKNVLRSVLGGLIGTGAWLAIYAANQE